MLFPSCSSYKEGMFNEKLVATQMLFGRVLLPVFIQNNMQYFYVVPI